MIRSRISTRGLATLVGAVSMSLLAAGCGSQGSSSVASSRTVTYWLWDSNQLPLYEECARGFENRNPGVKVRIIQNGWEATGTNSRPA